MKTINKIFMAIAVIILTPTVMLVAFILIADATDMDLESIVWETGTESLAEGETLEETPDTEVETDAEAAPEEIPSKEQSDDQTQEEVSRLAANPPASWQPTADNSALQKQLNMDAWIANPSSSAGSSTDGNTDQTGNLPDPAAYVKAYLDAAFKNSTNAYINFQIGTEEEAETLYEETLDEDTINDIMGTWGFEEVQEGERLDVMKRILANVRYNVGEAKKQDDGSYVVNVAYEKINVYVPAVDAYIKQAESLIAGWNRTGSAGGEVPSYEKMNEQLIGAYTECLSDALSKATYDTSQNATIRLRVVNGAYELNEEDATKFGSLVVDTQPAMEKLEKEMKEWDF